MDMRGGLTRYSARVFGSINVATCLAPKYEIYLSTRFPSEHHQELVQSVVSEFLGPPRNMPNRNLKISNLAQNLDFSLQVEKFDMFRGGLVKPETTFVNHL